MTSLEGRPERDVALPYTAYGALVELGRRGRWFESSRPDHFSRVYSGYMGDGLFLTLGPE